MAQLPSLGSALRAALVEGRSFAAPAWHIAINGGPNLAWLDRNLDKGFRARMVRRLKERSPSVANDKWWRATVTNLLVKYQRDGSYLGEGAHPAERELLRLFLARRSGEELLAAFDRALDHDCRATVAARYRQARHIGGESSWMRPRLDPGSLAVARINELLDLCPGLVGYANAIEFALEQSATELIELDAWLANRKPRTKDRGIPSCGRLHLTKRGGQLLKDIGKPPEEAIADAVTRALERRGGFKQVQLVKRVSPVVANADQFRRIALARARSHGRVTAAWLAGNAKRTLWGVKDDDPELVALLDRMAAEGKLVKQAGCYTIPAAAQSEHFEKLLRDGLVHLDLLLRTAEGLPKLRLIDALKARFHMPEQLAAQTLDLALGQGKIVQSEGLYYLPRVLQAREERRYQEALTRLGVEHGASKMEVEAAWRAARKDFRGCTTEIAQLEKAKDLILQWISKYGKAPATA